MACRLYGAKPLSEPVLDYYQLDPLQQSSVKFYSKCKIFHSWKCIWKHRLRNGGHFVQGEMIWYTNAWWRICANELGHHCPWRLMAWCLLEQDHYQKQASIAHLGTTFSEIWKCIWNAVCKAVPILFRFHSVNSPDGSDHQRSVLVGRINQKFPPFHPQRTEVFNQ